MRHYDWLPVPVIAFDADGRETYRNPAARGIEVRADARGLVRCGGRWYDVARHVDGETAWIAACDVTAWATAAHCLAPLTRLAKVVDQIVGGAVQDTPDPVG